MLWLEERLTVSILYVSRSRNVHEQQLVVKNRPQFFYDLTWNFFTRCVRFLDQLSSHYTVVIKKYITWKQTEYSDSSRDWICVKLNQQRGVRRVLTDDWGSPGLWFNWSNLFGQQINVHYFGISYHHSARVVFIW